MAHAYALHLPPGRPLSPRLFRFRSSAVRGILMERDATRWRPVPETRVRRFATTADRRGAWRPEAPGVWSARVGLARGLAWWHLPDLPA